MDVVSDVLCVRSSAARLLSEDYFNKTVIFAAVPLPKVPPAAVGSLFEPTCHSDADAVAAPSCSRLTPVHSRVRPVNIRDEAVRLISTVRGCGTIYIYLFGGVSLDSPLRGVSLLPTAQRD